MARTLIDSRLLLRETCYLACQLGLQKDLNEGTVHVWECAETGELEVIYECDRGSVGRTFNVQERSLSLDDLGRLVQVELQKLCPPDRRFVLEDMT